MEISETDYLKLCSSYDIFKKVGFENFEPKIWLIFLALRVGNVSQESVSSRPCQSLMEHNISFHQIRDFLEQLANAGIFIRSGNSYSLKPDVAYELHRVCYGMSKKIEKSQQSFKQLVIDCGYANNDDTRAILNQFSKGDDNAKSEALKDLLSQLAYSGARLLVKCIVKIEEKFD